jgi:hypothetical protein
LADFRRDQGKLIFGQTEYIHLDVQTFIRAEFGKKPPRQDVEVSEAIRDNS